MTHALSILSLAISLASSAIGSAEQRREELMAALKSGGYTILLRHARTDRSFNEQRDPVPTERSQQRNLNDAGIQDAKLMGVVFRKYAIPLGEIISSPMFRTLETAEMSAGKPTEVTMLLRVFPATPEQAALVGKPPRAGTNRLLVTHHFVIETHVPGITPGDIAESEAAVVRHTPDGKVQLVGRILLDDWTALANPAEARPITERKTDGDGVHGALARLLHGAPDANGDRPKVEVPDTHAGHIAREYVAAFNSGSEEKMQAFLESWMVQDPARPTADRLKTYAELYAAHGPLVLTAIHASAQLEVTLGMRSRRGDLRLTVKSAEAQPMRGTSVTFTMAEGAHR
jgi:phosphohistidine phosphatase SixA